jgi:NodT family efflux transporter outer membrane factor (OMF) lipoprotein
MKKISYFLIYIHFFLLTGCKMVGPDFIKPDAPPVAEKWSESADSTIISDQGDVSNWWTIFNDPVLDKLVETAYQQNLPLQIAGIRILEARAQLGIAVGGMYPQQQQATANFTHSELSGSTSSAGADTSFNSAGIGLGVGWELDMWGQFARGIEAADSDLMSSVANYDDVLVSLTSSVASAYSLIRTFEERIIIAKKNVEIQERSLSITTVRFENGATTELDVQQARTLLLNTKASIPSLQIGLQQSKHALSALLGLPPGNLDSLLQGESIIPSAGSEVAVGIPAELLRRRPDIRIAELNAAAQSARIGIAEADLYPHFSLIGTVGLAATDAGTSDLGDLFRLDSVQATLGPSISWNIFNYGRIKNNVRVQDARLQQLITNYENTVLEALREVEDALVGFLRAKEQVVFLEESVEAAQRSVDLALLQYRDGVADFQRVLDTQQSLVSQQDLLTSSRGEISTSLIDMYRALGGGWEIRVGEDFVPAETKEIMKERTNWGELLESGAEEIPESEKTKKFRKPDW